MESQPIEIVLAWSGGKDSALALAALQADPAFRVVALLTTVTADYDRISIHGVRRSVLAAQMAALQRPLPLIEAAMPAAASNVIYEESLADALARARSSGVDARHLAFGDLFLEDVRRYREELLARLGYTGVFPLWGRPTGPLAQRFVAEGYRAVLTCVDTRQLAADFAGREFDAALLTDLPDDVDPCGERGEFHTCVFDGPLFSVPVRLVRGHRVHRDGRFEYQDLMLA